MPVNIHGIDVEDQVYRDVMARGGSIVPCAGCGKVLLEVRNVRGDNYCINCVGKKSKLSRYSNAHFHPTQAQRQSILSSLDRAGGR